MLYVDEQRRCSQALQLYEDIGNGERTLYYEVAPVGCEGLPEADLMNEISEFSDFIEPETQVL